MDFDVPEITWEDVRQQVINRRLLLANSTPKWINSIWDQHHAIQPAMLRVPLVVCSFLLLWAVNVFFIERAKVPYYSVLSVKSISALAVFLRALAALGIYGLLVTSANVLHAELEQSMISFYLLVFVVAMLPFVPGLDYRLHFLRLLKQVFFSVPNRTYLALNPHARGGLLNLNRQRPGNSSPTAALTIEVEEAQSLLKENENAAISVVPFVEILLADALCSLSKVFKDLGTSAIAIFAYVSGTNVTSYHYSGMVIVALMASLPYLIRVRQCSIQLYYATDAHSRLLISINIFKYVTSFPSIWITAAVTLGYYTSSETIHWAIGFAVINSIVCYCWDIVMDWGLVSFSFTTGKISFRNRTYYPLLFYIFAVFSNFFFRFSWAINRLTYFGSLSPSQLILILEATEVFRRFIWNFIRIEWEVINTKNKAVKLENALAGGDNNGNISSNSGLGGSIGNSNNGNIGLSSSSSGNSISMSNGSLI